MDSSQLFELLKHHCEPLGLEPYLFKLSWYNELVGTPFKFDFDGDTVCAVIISLPSFFEKAFLPYLKTMAMEEGVRDPIDSCIAHHISQFENAHPDLNTTAMFDYELLPNRRPKVLVQTAAHVSRAAFYYQRKHVLQDCGVNDLETTTDACASREGSESPPTKGGIDGNTFQDPWGEKRIFGVCIHPKYGGWFSIRSVIIFHDVQNPTLPYSSPVDCVPLREDRIKLLNSLNFHWQDGTYRDIIPVEDRYSDLQMKYFSTLPKDRKKLIKTVFNI